MTVNFEKKTATVKMKDGAAALTKDVVAKALDGSKYGVTGFEAKS